MKPWLLIALLALPFAAGAYEINGVKLGGSELDVRKAFPTAHCKPLEWKSNAADRPPVAITHYSFDVMVGIGFGLLALAAWALWRLVRRRQSFVDSTWFLRAVAVSGPLSVAALLAGWIATEVGRQPWIVHLVLRTRDAVSEQPGLYWYFYGTVVVYSVLATSLVAILRRLARAPR
jgi:cytochrome d ubiquinol oxidase subunit I